MGPAQKSYDVKISSPFAKFGRREDRFLPLTRKGRFFEDSSFSTTHQHFDDAIRKILDKWDDDTDFELPDRWDDVSHRRNSVLDRYRRLRSQDSCEENQAVTVTSDNTSLKIVLDVHDFMEGDIKVQVLDEEELLIEGQASSHTFRRTFTLPHQTDLDAITSFISLDGIMTVTVPRLGSEPQPRPTTIPVTVEKSKEASETQKGSFSTSSVNTAEENVSVASDCARKSQNITSEETMAQKQEEFEVPIARSEPEEANIKRCVRDNQTSMSEETKTQKQEEFQIPIVMSEQEGDFKRTQAAESRGCQFSETKEKRTLENKEVIIPIIIEEGEKTNQTHQNQTVESKRDNQEASSTLDLKTEDQDNCATSGRPSVRFSSLNSSCGENTSVSSGDNREEAYVIPVLVEAPTETVTPQSPKAERASTRASTASEQQHHDRRHQHTAQQDSDPESDNSHRLKADKKRTTFSEEDEFLQDKRVYPSGSRYLPITRKGLFTQDPSFENVRPNFSQAVRDVLEMSREWTVKDKAMQNYRNLRDRNLKLENQAFCVTDDEFTHKVVVDVYDFTGGDITVQLVDGKELVVEGQAEKQEDTRISRLSFIRRFQLPPFVEWEAITVALSSDGVLTITSPKSRLPRGPSVRPRRSPSARRSQERASDAAERNQREKYTREPSEEFEDFDTRKSALHSFMNQF
ncbi:uncharacterized protein LOC122242308 [Penaeus japonicus]|uniref:uncharacterized protein LOC122242308 n=1 Tax=Penaeus japonicus TaxID=27405 RepID=UPI001C71711F|nr:uncharacterized protein LOC122242308 [Penaeus japonicus]